MAYILYILGVVRHFPICETLTVEEAQFDFKMFWWSMRRILTKINQIAFQSSQRAAKPGNRLLRRMSDDFQVPVGPTSQAPENLGLLSAP